MAFDVFISYSHEDKPVADAICARLEQDGVRCWYASRDIVPGMDWAECIIDAISHAMIMVLVFTDYSNVSQQVKREVSSAVSNGVTIMPFKLTEADPSKGMQYYLATVHWLDAMNVPLAQSVEQLSSLVRKVLGVDDVDAATVEDSSADVASAVNEVPQMRSAVSNAVSFEVPDMLVPAEFKESKAIAWSEANLLRKAAVICSWVFFGFWAVVFIAAALYNNSKSDVDITTGTSAFVVVLSLICIVLAREIHNAVLYFSRLLSP